MNAKLNVPIPDDQLETIAASNHAPAETVRRALLLYREMDEADTILRECDLLDGGDEE